MLVDVPWWKREVKEPRKRNIVHHNQTLTGDWCAHHGSRSTEEDQQPECIGKLRQAKELYQDDGGEGDVGRCKQSPSKVSANLALVNYLPLQPVSTPLLVQQHFMAAAISNV